MWLGGAGSHGKAMLGTSCLGKEGMAVMVSRC